MPAARVGVKHRLSSQPRCSISQLRSSSGTRPTSLAGKLVLITATAGTARHSLALEYALRPLFSYLRTVTVPTAVFAATEDFGSTGTSLAMRIERAAGELAALLAGRPAGPSTEPAFTQFDRLLGAGALEE